MTLCHNTVNILGIPIAAVNMAQAASQIEAWIHNNQKAYITVTGVHGIMESQYDAEVKRIHKEAAMCVPDGMPTVWIGKIYGHKDMDRVYGPDLMLEIMSRSILKGYTHFFYGGKAGVTELIKKPFCHSFPWIKNCRCFFASF